LRRDLNERALITWTASELARTLAMQGDVGGARSVLADPFARNAEDIEEARRCARER
jgi:hypothetical protein